MSAYWSKPLSSTAVSRQKQFEELTDVQFEIQAKPQSQENTNESAVFHTFKTTPTLGLAQALKNSLVQVKFLNVALEPRTMICTQCESFIPVSPKNKPTGNVKSVTLGGQGNPNSVLKVYSTDRRGWRSFRVDCVLNWHIHSTLSP